MVLEAYFANPLGLFGLLALIPILLLYLLRPAPRKQVIPSLMFLMRDRDKKSPSAFLQYLFRDLLLLIHILAIVLFAATLAEPFIEVPSASLTSNTVFVLDDSASMWAADTEGVRWEQARSEMRRLAGKENTIILAGSIPRVVLEDGSAGDVNDFLAGWKPSHQGTNLGSAILDAQTYASGADSHVVVLSDFAVGPDVRNALKTVRALGITVDTIALGSSEVSNVGLVDVQVREERTTVFVKNYDAQARTVSVCASGTCGDLELGAKATESWSFQTPPGITEVTIDVQDDFEVDNSLFVSVPTQTSIDVLVVTNDRFDTSFLNFAFQSIQETTPISMNIQTNTPPQLVDVDHDLVIYYRVDPNFLVGRTVRETTSSVRGGGAAIITVQEDLSLLDYEDLLPFTYEGVGEFSPVINTKNSQRFSDIEYGSVDSYDRVRADKAVQVLASAADESPLIALVPIGAGRMLYYGLREEASSFAADPQYPVFWKRALDSLLGRDSPEMLNRRVGEVVTSEDAIVFPSGKRSDGPTLLTEQGVYSVGERAIAVNVVSPEESDVGDILSVDSDSDDEGEGSSTRKQLFTRYILYGLLALLFLEILYIKWRGDI